MPDVGTDPFAPVELPEDIQRRLTVYKAAGGLCLIAVWGSFALVRNDRPLVNLNVSVHESEHVLFRPFGELTMLIMGRGSRLSSRSRPGSCSSCAGGMSSPAVCWRWAASALASAATYIADDGRPALLGATGPDAAGDWERILGQEFSDKVYLADSTAGTVRTFGYVLGSWLRPAAWAVVWNRRKGRAAVSVARPGGTACRRRRFPCRTTIGCGGSGSIGSLPELEYDAPASDRGSSPWLEAPS